MSIEKMRAWKAEVIEQSNDILSLKHRLGEDGVKVRVNHFSG